MREALPAKKKQPFLKRRRTGGRPRADDRKCFEAILWWSRTGLSWRRLPERFGSPRTASRRLAQWHRSGRLEKLAKRFFQFTGPTEREDWRRRIADAGAHSPEFWRLELRVILDTEWPREKSVILYTCAESSPWPGGLTPRN